MVVHFPTLQISIGKFKKFHSLGKKLLERFALAYLRDISKWNVQKVTKWQGYASEDYVLAFNNTGMDQCTKFKIWDAFKDKSYDFTVVYQNLWGNVQCPCIATSRVDLYTKIDDYIRDSTIFPCTHFFPSSLSKTLSLSGSHMHTRTNINTIGTIDEFDVSRVTSLEKMFCGHGSPYPEYACRNDRVSILTGVSLSSWNVNKVTSLESAFEYNTVVNFDFSNWNTARLENLDSAFQGTTLFEGIGLENWQTSRVVSMSETFSGALHFNGDLGTWDTSQVTSMASLFNNAERFTGRGNIAHWSVSKVTHFQTSARYTGELMDAFHGDTLLSTCAKYNIYASWNLQTPSASQLTSIADLSDNPPCNTTLEDLLRAEFQNSCDYGAATCTCTCIYFIHQWCFPRT